jgi:hypothetical protein
MPLKAAFKHLCSERTGCRAQSRDGKREGCGMTNGSMTLLLLSKEDTMKKIFVLFALFILLVACGSQSPDQAVSKERSSLTPATTVSNISLIGVPAGVSVGGVDISLTGDASIVNVQGELWVSNSEGNTLRIVTISTSGIPTQNTVTLSTSGSITVTHLEVIDTDAVIIPDVQAVIN